MPVRPESYKIVMILFYLLLCTKYLFQLNFAEEKVFAIAVEIKVARYQAHKKYRHHKNIGFDKIVWKFRWSVIKRRKNIGFAKISVSTK
jgi:hypothetical protein